MKDYRKFVYNAISSSIEGYHKYKSNSYIHIILPDKSDWVIAYADSGYTFYNYDFFCNFFLYLSIPKKKQPYYIKSWAKNVLGVNIRKHFYPDYIHGDYNWSDDFMLSKILDKGELIP